MRRQDIEPQKLARSLGLSPNIFCTVTLDDSRATFLHEVRVQKSLNRSTVYQDLVDNMI